MTSDSTEATWGTTEMTMFRVVKVQLHSLSASAGKQWMASPPRQGPRVLNEQGGSDGPRAHIGVTAMNGTSVV